MVRRALLTAVLSALVAPAMAGGAFSPRIVNGQPTTTADLPFMVGLQIAIQGDGDDSPDALCGGSLIAARWVLTAAHCLAEHPVDVQNSIAVIGATNLDASTPSQEYGWADAVYAAAYDTGGGGHDLGLVKLSRPANAQQLRLLRPRDGGLFEPGTEAITAGWGFTEDQMDGGQLSTTQLRSVGLDIVSDLDCANAFRSAGQSSDALDFSTEICAIAPDKDSCNGDSGGPLFVYDNGLPALVGAVSFGIGNGNILRGDASCNEGPPGVYAKAAADPLNDFVRDRVPQVEIDRTSAAVPGGLLTLEADARAPGGLGPFGGYDTLSWDLDGDEDYREQPGERSVAVRVPAGGITVGLLGTTTAGDAEVRRLRIEPQAKSAVSFAARRVTVRAGRSVKVRIARAGTGGGRATLAVKGRGITPKRRRLDFTGNERARTVRLRARRGGARTATLRLRGFGGDVVAGARTRATLKVSAFR